MSKALAIVEKSSLRPGQDSLYRLIVQKIETGETLRLEEAEHIWMTKVHSEQKDGVPYRFNFYDYGVLEPMSQPEIDFTVMNWLMRNIGLLVLRGYLKVVPMIELKQLGEQR